MVGGGVPWLGGGWSAGEPACFVGVEEGECCWWSACCVDGCFEFGDGFVAAFAVAVVAGASQVAAYHFEVASFGPWYDVVGGFAFDGAAW